jgi:hypothetical protein
MMITGKTTLAELQRRLHELDDPFITAMVGANRRYSVIVHLQGPGSASGNGDTLAEAMDHALAKLEALLQRFVGS